MLLWVFEKWILFPKKRWQQSAWLPLQHYQQLHLRITNLSEINIFCNYPENSNKKPIIIIKNFKKKQKEEKTQSLSLGVRGSGPSLSAPLTSHEASTCHTQRVFSPVKPGGSQILHYFGFSPTDQIWKILSSQQTSFTKKLVFPLLWKNFQNL